MRHWALTSPYISNSSERKKNEPVRISSQFLATPYIGMSPILQHVACAAKHVSVCAHNCQCFLSADPASQCNLVIHSHHHWASKHFLQKLSTFRYLLHLWQDPSSRFARALMWSLRIATGGVVQQGSRRLVASTSHGPHGGRPKM